MGRIGYGTLLVVSVVTAIAVRAAAWTTPAAGGSGGDTVTRAVMAVEKLDFAEGGRQDPRLREAVLEIEIHSNWAPVAAERFIELCASEFYDVRYRGHMVHS